MLVRRAPGDFARLEEMADVGAAEVLTGVAVAFLVDGAEIMGVLRVFDDQPPVRGKAGAVSGDARGQHAVEHVHPAKHALNQAVG